MGVLNRNYWMCFIFFRIVFGIPLFVKYEHYIEYFPNQIIGHGIFAHVFCTLWKTEICIHTKNTRQISNKYFCVHGSVYFNSLYACMKWAGKRCWV